MHAKHKGWQKGKRVDKKPFKQLPVMLPRNQPTPFPANFAVSRSTPLHSQLLGIPAPPRGQPLLTRNHSQMYRVAEAGLLHSAPIFSTVIDFGLKRVAGLDLARDGAPVVEPLGRGVPRVVGPFACQRHKVFLQHLDPWGLKFHHSLQKIC